MPLMVLTALSILSVIVGLDLLGRGAVEARGDDDDREVDVGELIEAELGVADDADHHDDEHQHRSRRPDAYAHCSEPLHVSSPAGRCEGLRAP